jgi:hypothetical protein
VSGQPEHDSVARLTVFAALEEPLPRRIRVPRLSLDDPDFAEKFNLTTRIDNAIQQASELLRAEIAPDLRAVLEQLADTQAREVVLMASRERAARIAGRLEQQRDKQRARVHAAEAERDEALARIDFVRYEIDSWNSRDHHLRRAVREALGDPTWNGDGPIPRGRPRPKVAAAPEPGEPDLSNKPLGEIDV